MTPRTRSGSASCSGSNSTASVARRSEPLDTIEWIDGVPVTQGADEDDTTTIETRSNWVSERLSDGRAHRFEVGTTQGGSATETKPVEQILQATRSSPNEVVAFINEGIAIGPWGRRLTIARGSARIRVSDGDRQVATSAAQVLRNEVVFAGRLWAGYPPARSVNVMVYPSASQNLTVIEVLPIRIWPGSTSLFLRAGVASITQLTDEIEASG